MISITVVIDDYAGYEVGLLAQHGFSALIDTGDCKILFDTGQSGRALLNNLHILGIDLKQLDYIILSHRHYDHTGGLLDVLDEAKKRILIIAHPDIVKPNYALKPRLRSVGLPYSLNEVHKRGGELVLSRKPLRILDNIYFLGEIPRDPEFIKLPETYTINSRNELVPDNLNDDTALAIKLDADRVIIVTGCSHSGIVNIVRYTKEVLGVEAVEAIIGGLHLINADDVFLERVCKELRKLNVNSLHVGHCTGFNAISYLRRVYGDKVKIIHSGYKLVFT